MGPGQQLGRDDAISECGRENRCECVREGEGTPEEGTPEEGTLGEEGCELWSIFWALLGVLCSLGLS